MSNIAIIPARGGSKRIPRKNIKAFIGKPIIAYSIETAINSKLFDEVMVSTDDLEIAEIAKKYGANVPFLRSNETADDNATTIDVLIEVINSYKLNKKKFDFGCCLYPTAPLTQHLKLIEAYELMKKKNFDAVLPIIRFSYPIQRSLKLTDGKVEMNWREYINSRSQDLLPSYHDSGQFYWFNIDKLIINNELFSENTGGIEISEIEAQDIDNNTDWELAELKYKLLFSK